MADVGGLVKRAEEAFNKKNYDYARDLYLNALAADPNHEVARKSLYATCLRKLQEQGSKSKLTSVFLKGKIEVQLNTTKDAAKKVEIAQKHLCEEPNDVRVRTALAQSLSELGHLVGAGAEAQIVLNIDGKNLTAAKILVASYTHQNRILEAQKVLDQVAAHAGEDRDILKLQRDLAAKQTMKAGFEDAKSYRDVIKDKSHAELLEMAHHSIQTEEQFVAITNTLREEMNANPTDARIPKKIADLYFEKKKDYNEAREWYKKASAIAPHDTVLKDKVDDCSIRIYDVQIEQAQKAGDPRLAQLKTDRLKFVIQSFERRVQDRPTDMPLRLELGKAYYQAGPAFTDKAISEFQQAVKDPKKKLESHIFLGKCFFRKKSYVMAEGQYAKAEESGLLQEQLQLDIWYNRALCNYEAGKREQAIALANKIIEVNINFRDINQLLEKWQGAASS